MGRWFKYVVLDAEYARMPKFVLDGALNHAVRVGASDLHVKVPSVPRIRVNGELIDLPGSAPISPEDAEDIKQRVLRSELARERYETRGATDVSYYTEASRFRVNAFRQRGSPSFVFRVIPAAPDAEALGLPDTALSWAKAHRGMVMITGPTGSGKSTTGAALLGLINERRSCHIITVEDPVEYLHSDQRALVSQREIGPDAPSYAEALRSALRQDPDVIFVGEVRDEDTAMTALRAADTGHLVICTMHCQGAVESIRRFINLCSSDYQDLVRFLLADTLIGITSQRLVPGIDGQRRLNAELLVNTPRIRDMILENEPNSTIEKAIAEGEFYGMRTFDQCLLRQVSEGTIDQAAATSFATHPHDFKLALQSSLSSNGHAR
jgi:twitching motility protein PilT